MNVFVSGGTGFVGSHLVPRLLAEGHRVRVLARDPNAARAKFSSVVPQLEFIRGDVVANQGLDEGSQNCDAVINLVGIIMEVGGATFEKSHFEGTRNVLASAKKNSVKRFLQMSALGARENGVSGYQTTKWRAEEAIRASGVPHVILRPSIIFGPRDGFVSQMVSVMKSAPLIRPVVGTGQYPFRPIYIDDVVECFVQSLTSERALGQAIDLVGPKTIPLEQLLDTIAECVGIRKPAVKIPFPIMYMNAAVLGAILPRPPVTTDQLRMLKEGSTADSGPMMETFNLHPVGFCEGLNRYLCKPPAK